MELYWNNTETNINNDTPFQVPPPNVSLQPTAKWQGVGVGLSVGDLGPGPRIGPNSVNTASSHLRLPTQAQALQYPQGPLQ